MASGIGGNHANLTSNSLTNPYPNDKPARDLEKHLQKNDVNIIEAGEADTFEQLLEAEAHNEIKYRTMGWKKVTALLFAEYVCLAILALSWSWSVVGWVGGALITFILGIITWYTSYVEWQYIMKHPSVRDICDIGYLLFGGSKVVYEITAVFLLLNNIFLMGFHVFTGSKILNTLSNHSQCTVVFQAIIAIMGVIVSIPRTLNHVSLMGIVSAAAMLIAIILTLVYAGIEDNPTYGYNGDFPTVGPVQTSIGAPGKPTFVNALNATLNITFLWVGQILYPSFIAEMERPQDFPKALAALSIMELILFCVTAAVGYYYIGQYSTAPIIGSLTEPWARKSAFAFVLVPTLVIGAIYSNVAAKFLYKRILGNSRHTHSHTAIGWGVWIAIVVAIWAVAFVLGNVIPSMGDFLSIMSALFDSFFGFIFWALAYFSLNSAKGLFRNVKTSIFTILNILIFLIGVFMLGPGMYTSVEAIILDYSGTTRAPFTCQNNAL